MSAVIAKELQFGIITYTITGIRGGSLLETIISSVEFCISLHERKGMLNVGMLDGGRSKSLSLIIVVDGHEEYSKNYILFMLMRCC
jgi:hypothetical protein